MAVFGALQAKTHFSDLLERVENGEQITITRHGKPVAKIVPIGVPDRERVRCAVERLKAFRKGQTLDGLRWQDLRDEGRP